MNAMNLDGDATDLSSTDPSLTFRTLIKRDSDSFSERRQVYRQLLESRQIYNRLPDSECYGSTILPRLHSLALLHKFGLTEDITMKIPYKEVDCPRYSVMVHSTRTGPLHPPFILFRPCHVLKVDSGIRALSYKASPSFDRLVPYEYTTDRATKIFDHTGIAQGFVPSFLEESSKGRLLAFSVRTNLPFDKMKKITLPRVSAYVLISSVYWSRASMWDLERLIKITFSEKKAPSAKLKLLSFSQRDASMETIRAVEALIDLCSDLFDRSLLESLRYWLH